MLYQLGPLQFAKTPVGVKEYAREAEADFAWKDIAGGLRPAEAVGLGNDEITLRCAMFPHRFGGLTELQVLYSMLEAQQEQILVRGDGFSLGWRVLTKISELGTVINFEGIGRCIEVQLGLKRVPSPSAGQSATYLTTILDTLS